MNNDNDSNNNSRGSPFSHNFHIGTTIQNVFRNINHAFSNNHESSGQHRDDDSRDRADDIPPLEPLDSVGGTRDMSPTDTAHRSPIPAPNSSVSSASPPADVDMPPSQPDSQRDDDEDSMPDLRSVSDTSDSSDVGVTAFNPLPPHQDVRPVGDDRSSGRPDDEGDPPLQPTTGTRRARVDDDGDDARDRRHPSERVGGPPPLGDAAPQNANPQHLPRPPAGLFGALFGLGPPGPNLPPREGHPEHVQTGEDTADPSPTGNDATPGRAPHGVPILTAGFTLTIPLFGPPQGNRPGPAPGGQGAPPSWFNMDAAAREELFASFAAFFQEFQAMDEGREDPERAKKLVAGLEVVPLGLVKRLERVGGAPGGHLGDISTEGSASGCAICWDTLLDGESDNFVGQQSLSPATDTVQEQNNTHTESGAMDVDAPSVSVSHSEAADASASTPPSEAAKIISLPCAHVFHASCLLPWFTRAKQATCPTCRFNIDPENLTYTPPPRRAFNRPPPAQPNNGAANPAPSGPPAAPEVPLEAPATGTHAADSAAPPAGPAHTTDARPATAAVPPGPAPPPPTGQAGVPPAGLGFNPFATPGIPILSFPAIQIPLGPTAAQAPGDGNQGTSFLPTALRLRSSSTDLNS
ncbi:hypothetical protein HD554DRAFT_739324 [Boletus coccyginus]|nr:hypothetical protein HD554DRAFT_739324 [Boletus coccyginus]